MIEIGIFLIGFLLGILVRSLLSFHKHEWEVLWHGKCNTVDISTLQTFKLEYGCRRWSEADLDEITGIYRRCSKCNKCEIKFLTKNGEDVKFDYDIVKAELDTHIKLEKEEQDKKLFEKVNSRLS